MIIVDVRALESELVLDWVSEVAETIHVVVCEPPSDSPIFFPDNFYSLGAVVRANPVSELSEFEFWQRVFKSFPSDTAVLSSLFPETVAVFLTADNAPVVRLVHDGDEDKIMVV